MQGRWLGWAFLVPALGVGFGFAGVVLAIGHASLLGLPSGIEAKEYVTVGRRVAETGDFADLSVPDYLNFKSAMPGDWAYANRTIQEVLARDASGQSRKVIVRDVSTNFFDVLGVAPALGELFTQHRGVVVSHAFWQRRYQADDVIGMVLELTNELPRTIVGVAPADFADVFASGNAAEVWVLNDSAGYAGDLGARLSPTNKLIFGTFHQTDGHQTDGHQIDGRETDGMASLEALAADFEFARSVAIGPNRTRMLTVAEEDRLQGVHGLEAHPDRRDEAQKRLAWLAVAIVVMLLLVFLSLVDSLTAAQEARLREQVVRIAVGAAPKHLFVEAVFANALWLLPIALVAALTFSYLGSALLAIEPFATHPGGIPPGAAIVGLGAGGILLIAAFAGAVAWVAYSVSKTSKRLESVSMRGLSGHRLVQGTLVCITTVSLLVVASLAGRYVVDAGQSLGFDSDVTIAQPLKRHGVMLTNAESEALGEALRAIPTVRAAARAEMVPLISRHIVPSTRVRLVVPDALHGNLADVHVFRNAVDAGYFETVGVDFVAGRSLGDASSEVVVSLGLAKLLAEAPSEVLGLSLGVEAEQPPDVFAREAYREAFREGGVYTVVGVVRDVPYLGYGSVPPPVVYMTGRHRRIYDLHLVGFGGSENDLADLAQQSFPALESVRVETLQRVFNDQFAQRRSVELVLAGSAAMALILGIAGVWASFNRTVVDARASLGMHFALGAARTDATARQLRTVLIDVLCAALLIVAIDVLVAALAPSAATFELSLAVPALALVLLLCAAATHTAVRDLARHPINELVAG